jgi:hypothetical protein
MRTIEPHETQNALYPTFLTPFVSRKIPLVREPPKSRISIKSGFLDGEFGRKNLRNGEI